MKCKCKVRKLAFASFWCEASKNLIDGAQDKRDNTLWFKREIWQNIIVAISPKLEKPCPPNLVCTHFASTSTCMKFLTTIHGPKGRKQFKAIIFFTSCCLCALSTGFYDLLSLSTEDNEQVSIEERKELGNWQKVFAVVTSRLFL